MKIRLLQNCIETNHFDRVQSGFEPLDFRDNRRPDLREFQIFRALYEQGEHRKVDVLGAVSIRFEGKSLLDGTQVRQWIEDNPGYDVYVVNPYPHWPYLHKNFWQFSENTRPPELKFTARSQAIFDRLGIDFDLANTGYQSNRIFSACSYWFGSEKFWDEFMTDVVLPVLNARREDLGDELYDFLYKPQSYYGVTSHPCGGLPFLLERSVSMYLAKARNIRAKFYPASRERIEACCMFDFERDVVTRFGDMVDGWAADETAVPEMDRYFEMTSRMCGAGLRLYFEYAPPNFEGKNLRVLSRRS